MRTLISLVVAAFVLVFIFSADLAAGETEWEKRLMKDGWVKVKETLTTLADTTWYRSGFYGSGDKYTELYYVSADGKLLIWGDTKMKLFDKGVRRQREDGLICQKWMYLWLGRERCFSTWKKDKHYRFQRESGMGGTRIFSIKKGNTENLK